MTRDPLSDPRVHTGTQGGEPTERSVRPVVALPRSGPSTLVLSVALAVAAILLFTFLNARRQSLGEPSVKARAADSMGIAPPPPPLYIPPVQAPPATLVQVPQAAPQPQPTLRPMPPAPLPQSRIVYTPQSVAPAISQAPPPPPQRVSNGPTLVIDTTAAAPAAAARGQALDAPGGAAAAGGARQFGGRARSSMFANRATTVPQGTLIPAVLETAFNSTMPGLARGIVSRDVRGFDGTRVLIPRGSRLTGEYRSDVARGQKRALINWTRLVRPDGVTIALDSPATDPLGRGGVGADVNSHFLERFAGAFLRSALEIGTSLAGRAASNNVILALPGSASTLALPVNSDRVVPTLTVRAGTSISVFVARDLDFSNAGMGR